MYGSLVGRLDPRTGEMAEFVLDPMARPHSIINDVAGNIWYTGNSNARSESWIRKPARSPSTPMAGPRRARSSHTHIRA